MSVRSDRLFGPVLLGAGATVVYPPAPPGLVITLMKDLRIVNVTDDDQTFDCCFDTHDAAHAHFWRAVVPARSLINDGSWCAIEPAEALLFFADNADALTVRASGAKLV